MTNEYWENKLLDKTIVEDDRETALSADQVIITDSSYQAIEIISQHNSHNTNCFHRFLEEVTCLMVTEFCLQESLKQEIFALKD